MNGPGIYLESAIHRLDAGVKVAGLLLLTASVIAAATAGGYALLLIVLALILHLSRLPLGTALASVGRLRRLFIVIFLMNALFFSSGRPLWSWGIISLTPEGMRQGTKVVFNVAYIMVLANVLIAATTPIDLTAGLVRLLKPLAFLRVPVDDAAMIIGIAIRFIPTLLEEAGMIKKAQTARGARFESRKFRARAASFWPLLIPVFLSAFRRADELALAMESRGYRNARDRTRKAAKPLKGPDFAALGLSFLICFFQFYLLWRRG